MTMAVVLSACTIPVQIQSLGHAPAEAYPRELDHIGTSSYVPLEDYLDQLDREGSVRLSFQASHDLQALPRTSI